MIKSALLSVFLLQPAAGFAAGKVEVELYVMSQCPYGTQAEDALFPVLKDYSQTELKLGFIGDMKDGADGKTQFGSLHGQPEVDENIRQLCARELAPGKWLDYVLARNKAVKSPDWQSVAKAAGIDAAAMEACFKEAGVKKYIDNLSLAKARKADASPTIYIDGAVYSGPRTREGFEWDVCAALKKKGGAVPASCAKALASPKPAGGPGGGGDGNCGSPVSFDIRIVNESGCKVCAPSLLETIKKFHPSAKIIEISASSAEGKALIARHGARALPLYVLDKAVEGEPKFQETLSNFYSVSAGAYIIKPGPGIYLPVVQLDRKKDPYHLDIFVEALSPLTVQVAADLSAFLSENADSLKDLSLSWHLVTQEAPSPEAAAAPSGSKKVALAAASPTRLTATGGDAEVAESVRQACLFQYASFSDFMTYLNCRYYNTADSGRAASCLRPEGNIKTCIESGEGEKFLRADAKFAAGLEIKAPAFMWENRYGPFKWGSVDLRTLIER